MKEINIGKTLVNKRREKGLTQEEVARYMGVSKASVSKWETGQSYPDITFLPLLAAYFNVTIDSLMAYAPQLTKGAIKDLYQDLSTAFANQPFAEALLRCQRAIKKYYACFPLLMQMAILLVNHHMLADQRSVQEDMLKQAVDLCRRIKIEGDDLVLAKEANSFEGVCHLLLQGPEETLALLGESTRPMSTDLEIVGQAYQMMGNVDKAKEVVQISSYQHLLALLGATPSMLMLYADDACKCEEILKRALGLADLYHVDDLHGNTMGQIYFTAAQVYSMQAKSVNTLEMLEAYTKICCQDFSSLMAHGDGYFDGLGPWFDDFDLGAQAPRSARVVKEGMLQSVMNNPGFAFIRDEPRYKQVINKLQANRGGL